MLDQPAFGGMLHQLVSLGALEFRPEPLDERIERRLKNAWQHAPCPNCGEHTIQTSEKSPRNSGALSLNGPLSVPPTHPYQMTLYGRDMATIRQLVVDVLKPHEPTMLSIAQEIADTDGVDGVNALLLEMDEEVRNIKCTIEGSDIDYEAVTTVIEDTGASVHSVDQVACGNQIVEDMPTPQD